MTTSNRSPAAAQPGSISAALPTSAIDSGRPAAAASRAHASASAGIGREPVDVADVEPAPRPRLVDLDREADAAVHRHRERLGAAHPAEARRQHEPSGQRPAEVLAGQLGERLVRALEDPLGPDVDPGPGGHLAVHHQALALELAEDLPGRPVADEVRVRDQDPRRPLVGPEDRDGLAGLDEQRLVVGEGPELADDRVERVPAPRRAAGPAVDDERVGVLGDLRVEVVHQHPEGGFLRPAAAGQLRPAGSADGPRSARHRPIRGHGRRARAGHGAICSRSFSPSRLGPIEVSESDASRRRRAGCGT